VTEIFTTGIANVKATYGKDSKHPLSDERVSRIQACMQYSIIQGSTGIREDRLSFLKPWGFSVSELAIPTQFWAGTADSDVPLEHSLWMARKIRNSELHVLEGKDHFTIMERGFLGGFRWLRGVLNS
jgi:pimeloyl-ACP methyl ester carboxylesterase